MIPNVVKGADMGGLTRYLVSQGSKENGRNVHTNPHVVAGDGFLTAWHGANELDQAAAADIAKYLDEPRNLYGVEMRTKAWQQNPETGAREPVTENGRQAYKDVNVWHCSLSLPAEDGPLSDEQWDAIATDFMDEMEFTGASGKAPARWVAIHHGASKNGNDHIHIAASMVREDGTKWAGGFRDYPKTQQVCRALEVKYGLTPVDGRQHGTVAPSIGKTVDGQPVGSRDQLAHILRSSAVASTSEAEWLRRVQSAGVVIKPRFEAGTTDVVAGYRAALKTGSKERLNFYGGGQVGNDLSLPRIRENWPEPTIEQADAAAAEWQAAFKGQRSKVTDGRETKPLGKSAPEVAASNLQAFSRRLSSIPANDRMAWADAARDVSGALSAWAQHDPANAAQLRAAAAVLATSAQQQRPGGQIGRRVKESPMGTALILLAARSDGPKMATAALMQQLLNAAAAIRDYHRTTGNSRQTLAVQRRVIEPLEAIVLPAAEPVAATRSPLPNQLAPRPQIGARTTREDQHHGR